MEYRKPDAQFCRERLREIDRALATATDNRKWRNLRADRELWSKKLVEAEEKQLRREKQQWQRTDTESE